MSNSDLEGKVTTTRRQRRSRVQSSPEVQKPEYVEVKPGEAGPSVAVGKSYEGIDFEEVWKVDVAQSPMAIFKKALTEGSLKMDVGDGKLTECKLTGIDFYLQDAGGLQVSESLDLDKSRQVFLEGKDVEIFTPAFREAYAKRVEEAERLEEDFKYPDGGRNTTDTLNIQFRPLGNGPLNQQLYLSYQWDMLAKAFEAVNHNPYARRVIDILVDFTLGRGFSINFRDPNLQEMWDENMEALDFEDQLYIMIRDLERQGELFLQPIYNSSGRISDIINIEASTIWEVITDPENIRKVLGYWQQYQTPIQLFGMDGKTPEFRYVVRTFTVDEIIHLKINQSGSEKRGRSTLFPAFEYLKMSHDYLAAATNKAIASACTIFDWSVEGTPTDVATFAASIPVLNHKKPIASVFHSANATLSMVQTTEVRGRDAALENVVNAIAVATGIGKEYLGASGNATRAGALTGTEPAVKHFEQRQKVITYLFKLLVQDWIDHGIEAGTIDETRVLSPKDKLDLAIASVRKGDLGSAIGKIYSALNGQTIEMPIDRTIHVKFPEIVKGDITQILQNIAYMQGMGWWSPERAAVAATQEWGGIDNYDYHEEQKAIDLNGVKPIVATLQQVPMVDPANPNVIPGSGNTDSAGVDKTPDRPAPKVLNGTSGNTDVNGRARNNPAGLGASSLRKAMNQVARFKILSKIGK